MFDTNLALRSFPWDKEDNFWCIYKLVLVVRLFELMKQNILKHGWHLNKKISLSDHSRLLFNVSLTLKGSIHLFKFISDHCIFSQENGLLLSERDYNSSCTYFIVTAIKVNVHPPSWALYIDPRNSNIMF